MKVDVNTLNKDSFSANYLKNILINIHWSLLRNLFSCFLLTGSRINVSEACGLRIIIYSFNICCRDKEILNDNKVSL